MGLLTFQLMHSCYLVDTSIQNNLVYALSVVAVLRKCCQVFSKLDIQKPTEEHDLNVIERSHVSCWTHAHCISCHKTFIPFSCCPSVQSRHWGWAHLCGKHILSKFFERDPAGCSLVLSLMFIRGWRWSLMCLWKYSGNLGGVTPLSLDTGDDIPKITLQSVYRDLLQPSLSEEQTVHTVQ